jgi:hypothetical protein
MMQLQQIGSFFVRETFSFGWRLATSAGSGPLIRPLPGDPRKPRSREEETFPFTEIP